MLAKRLRELRGQKTQDEVAQDVGITRARYSHYENSRNEPDVYTLQKLADYFNVSVDYLLTGRERNVQTVYDEQTAYASDDIRLTYEEKKIWEAIRQHPKYREFIADLSQSPECKIHKLIRVWEIIQEEEREK